MGFRRDKYQQLREQLEGQNVDPSIREEMDHHLASRIEDNVARGMSRADAERDARRRFGDVDHYRRETGAEERQTRAYAGRRERLGAAAQEAARAIRSLGRRPGFAAAAIMTLGIGIAAAVAVFTILDAVVLRPLPYPAAERLVRIYHPVPKVGPDDRWNISAAEYFHFRAESRTLETVALYGNFRITASANGSAIQINAGRATETTLPLLGARPLLGRLFTADDNLPRRSVVLLSERFWRRQYGASNDVLGTTIRLEGADSEIIGVVAGTVDLPDWAVDVWVPMGLNPAAEARNNHVYWGLARLADGATAEDASRELAAMVPGYVDRFPSAYSAAFFDRTGFSTVVVPWKEDVVGDADRSIWVVFAAAALVLVLAAVNVGNLFLVRSQAVRRDMAVRALLGADRARLAWHFFAESAVITAAATVLGVAMAWSGLRLMLDAVPAGVSRGAAVTVPRLAEVSLDPRGLLFAAALGLVAFIVLGLIPFVVRPGSVESARSARGSTGSKGEVWTRSFLVVAQVALSVVLLAAAGLMVRSFERLRAVEPGFDVEGLLVADLALPFNGYVTYPKTTAFYRALVERTGEIPGVASAAVGSSLPIESEDGCSLFDYPGRPEHINSACIRNAVVGPGYFTTLGAAVEGRDMAWTDLDANTGAVLMSDALGRRLFEGDALEKPVNGPNPRTSPPYTVTGVVRGLVWDRLDRPPPEVAFFPLQPIPDTWLWSPPARMKLLVRVERGDPVSVVPAVREVVRSLDPEVAFENPRTMEQVMAGSMLRVRLVMVLLAVSALAALALSVVGLYGVVAYTVARRTREIGVRIAVGAPVARVKAQVVRQALAMAGAGLIVGLGGAVLLGRLMQSLLFGVGAADPFTLGAVVVLLLTVAVGASLGPAARAASIDPVAALREE